MGDGESETGPLASSWQINKVFSPKENGAVLPIVHLNGYKISGPTFFGRMSDDELKKYFEGLGYEPMFINQLEDNKKESIFSKGIKIFDKAYKSIKAIQEEAKTKDLEKPKWPVIILRTEKGWTGAKEVDGVKTEGNCASHQVICKNAASDDIHLKQLEEWMKSYKIKELFKINEEGVIKFDQDIESLIPEEGFSCGTQKHSYGGDIKEDLEIPDINKLSVDIHK